MSHGTTLPIVAEGAQSPNLTLLIPDRQTWTRTGKTKVGPGGRYPISGPTNWNNLEQNGPSNHVP